MSLGIVFKGPEGIVLATDSRVTLMGQLQQPNTAPITFPSTFDNATKLLKVTGQDYVGAVTYGRGALGGREPRTAHSFIPEFESELFHKTNKRLTVREFAQHMGEFYNRQWHTLGTPDVQQDLPMVFLIGGYDPGASYGSVFEVKIPTEPTPRELNAGPGSFGITGGGQDFVLQRLLAGYDNRLLSIIAQRYSLDQNGMNDLRQNLRSNLQTQIPFQFLPLQDCVDLTILILRTTIELQRFMVDMRGVGGHIDVATITRTEGFRAIQSKKILGER